VGQGGARGGSGGDDLLWRGSTVYWGLTFLRFLLWSLVSRRPRLAFDYAVSFAAAAAVLGLFVLIDPWGGARAVSFGIVSSFHVVVLVSAAIILAAAGSPAIADRWPQPSGRWQWRRCSACPAAGTRGGVRILGGLAFLRRSAIPGSLRTAS